MYNGLGSRDENANLQGGRCPPLTPFSFARMPYRSKDSQRAYQRSYRLQYKATHTKRSITLTNAEDRIFARHAKDERTSVPMLIKRMALAYTRQERFIPRELCDRLDTATLLLRNYGNNLNQIAHRLNIDTIYRRVAPSTFQALDILRDLFKGFQTLEMEINQHIKTAFDNDYKVNVRQDTEFSQTVRLYQSQIRCAVLHITQSQSS
jgi:hypothetical protein